MIQTFACKDTEKLYRGISTRRLPTAIQRTARRKLIYIDESENVDDLKAPPGNKLHKLSGTRDGQWSIRINNQWRICFNWSDKHAYDVEIIDYHS